MITKSPIENLYFASAWSPIGGGYSGAIFGGFLTAMKIDKVTNWKKYNNAKINNTKKVKLISKKYISENTIELTFEKPEKFQYKAGQYTILSLINPKYTDLDLPHRPLSLVSSPYENVLKFAMRISNSSFKKSVTAMEIGDEVCIYGPMGDFTIDIKNMQNIVFFAAGIGITPIISILK